MIKMCFVILHYMALGETVECVQSIKKMQMQESIRIVIVDNASPNGSGRILKEKYESDEQIHVICNEDNAGFSNGNNLGCSYARERWNPEFYVVANNDILFIQEEFPMLVQQEYEKSGFAVLGMDIYNTNLKVHQSPISKSIPNKAQINKTIFLNRIMLYTMKVSYPLMKYWFQRLDSGRTDAKDFDVYQKNVCVMGACLVFAQAYMEKREKAFWPETKFYYEEYLLALWSKRNHETIVYTPEISVFHKEGVATGMSDENEKKRMIFRMKNILDAALIYRRELIEPMEF